MITVKTNDLKTNFKQLSQLASDGEAVCISRPHNENLYLVSELDYRQMSEGNLRLAYDDVMAKLDEAQQEVDSGAPLLTLDKAFIGVSLRQAI